MARQLLLYPQTGDTQAQWWRLDGGQVLEQGHGSLQEALSRRGRRERVRLLLPPPQAMLHAVEAVAGHFRQMQKAAPWALEDQLLTPVETLAIQPARQPLEGQWPVAVLEQPVLARYQALLEAQGVQQAELLPAVAALPGSRAQPALCLTRGLLVWHNGERAFVVPQDQWQALLRCEDLNLPAVTVLRYWQDEGQPLPEDWKADHPAWQGKPLEKQSGSPLVQSGLQPHQPVWSWLHAAAQKAPSWKWTALLAVLLLASWLGRDYWLMQRWNGQAEQLKQQMEQIYRRSFPDARRVVDAQAQMRQRLDALRRAAGEQVEGSLLTLLQQVGPALARPGLRLQSLRYRQGVLEVEVKAADLARLDQLRQAMEQASGQPVRMTVTTEAGEGATAQLRLGEGVRP